MEDGDCIFINTSSTALGLLEFINAQDVTVITNNGKALMLEERQNVSVLLTGGEIRPPRASMTGEIAMETIKRVTAAKSFLGCTGLSANFGLTSATSPEPAINSVMLEHSKQHVIVADSSKIGLTSSFQFGSIDEIDLLITDTGISDDQVQLLMAYGVKESVRVEPVLSPSDYDPIPALRSRTSRRVARGLHAILDAAGTVTGHNRMQRAAAASSRCCRSPRQRPRGPRR